MSKSYYKLEIDSKLWHAFKSKCAANGKSMIEVLIDFIVKYTNRK